MELGLELIRRRISIRSFDGRPLGSGESQALAAAFEACLPCPFGGAPRFVLVEAREAGLAGEPSRASGKIHSGKIGTYGLIRGAPAFIVGAVERGAFAMEDFGYALEGIVLKATELGLGSCWIGGIFKRSEAGRHLGLKGSELMPAILALGRPAPSASLPERFTRMSARAGTRKPFHELFFDTEFGKPLEAAATGAWAEVLEAVRLGPSASNKQPWRIVMSGASGHPAFHLYLEEDPIYNKALGEVHIQDVDIGIAMRHFEAAAGALGLPGSWRRLGADPLGRAAPSRYIASWLETLP